MDNVAFGFQGAGTTERNAALFICFWSRCKRRVHLYTALGCVCVCVWDNPHRSIRLCSPWAGASILRADPLVSHPRVRTSANIFTISKRNSIVAPIRRGLRGTVCVPAM